MRKTLSRPLAHAAFLIALLLSGARPGFAQSILRDAETEALLNDMAAPLVEAAGLQPGNVDIVLINDPSVNAFVAGGQAIYIHSGLINEADSALQVQGVIAHELGHITGGHIIGFSQGAKQASNISILSLLLGAAAAVAGAGEAAMGVLAAGQQAAMGKFLSFTRGQESAADLAGAQYLAGAGLSGRGSIEFFKKLQSLEHRAGHYASQDDTFYRTHPLSRDRIETLVNVYQHDPAWQKPLDDGMENRFRRIKAKLYGYQAEPKATLVAYPESDQSVAAHYARAFARNKESLIGRSVAEIEALLLAEPDNPYFLELKGQVLLESGKPAEALAPLRRAVELSGNQPLIATMFGQALLATEDRNHGEEAERVLRNAVARDRENPTAWYLLGRIYAERGDTPRARLASAEQLMMTGQPDAALQNASAAEAALPAESVDWLRAQDIRMEARDIIEQRSKRK
ncbi:tetratricopeptide repeat protein [Croceicoccus ponticola]|uniref:Tetratricopeptide repeat protein n=1 Tax=Croceicoccus ponticola TaxID=2217664 RepID=A0A437GYX1_9SPHN|nr:M48 family metalloprotease [Croceicoccus ponticola]RVQ67640.1 tetratricopeptide repeat protein [Croceicoccus ponticola]